METRTLRRSQGRLERQDIPYEDKKTCAMTPSQASPKLNGGHRKKVATSWNVDSAYLSCNGASATSAVEPPGRTTVVVVATSGNCCRKLARRSSPGFCELLKGAKKRIRTLQMRCDDTDGTEGHMHRGTRAFGTHLWRIILKACRARATNSKRRHETRNSPGFLHGRF